PRQILDRPLATDRLKQAFEKSMGIVGRIERLVRPRWAWITRTSAHRFFHGLALALAAGLLMLPFGLVPFSNTLPALAALLLALGLIERDGVFILGGHLMNVATVIYFSTLVGGAIMAGRGLAGLLGS